MKANLNNHWFIDAFNAKTTEGVGYTDNNGNSIVINSNVKFVEIGRGIEFRDGKTVFNVVDFERFTKIEFYSEGVFLEDKEGNMLMVYTKYGEFVKNNLIEFGCIE